VIGRSGRSLWSAVVGASDLFHSQKPRILAGALQIIIWRSCVPLVASVTLRDAERTFWKKSVHFLEKSVDFLEKVALQIFG
jgi:hypothetical protein